MDAFALALCAPKGPMTRVRRVLAGLPASSRSRSRREPASVLPPKERGDGGGAKLVGVALWSSRSVAPEILEKAEVGERGVTGEMGVMGMSMSLKRKRGAGRGGRLGRMRVSVVDEWRGTGSLTPE